MICATFSPGTMYPTMSPSVVNTALASSHAATPVTIHCTADSSTPTRDATTYVATTARSPNTIPASSFTITLTSGLSGVRRSCRVHPCARSTATAAPVWVADIIAPYIAIDTMMYAATDTPPSAIGTCVSGVSSIW